MRPRPSLPDTSTGLVVRLTSCQSPGGNQTTLSPKRNTSTLSPAGMDSTSGGDTDSADAPKAANTDTRASQFERMFLSLSEEVAETSAHRQRTQWACGLPAGRTKGLQASPGARPRVLPTACVRKFGTRCPLTLVTRSSQSRSSSSTEQRGVLAASRRRCATWKCARTRVFPLVNRTDRVRTIAEMTSAGLPSRRGRWGRRLSGTRLQSRNSTLA